MPDIRHKIGVKGSESAISKALSTEKGLASWWTRDTQAENYQGGNIYFSFAKRLDKKFDVGVKIVELQPKKISWSVFEGPEEWLGTQITFDIHPEDDETIIYFTHSNWAKPTDFMAQCNTKWAVFLLSLKDLIETGKGHPFPDDIRIGHSGA